MDIEIDEIAVTIDERSVEYNVGEHQDSGIKSNTFVNPYASSPTINVARGGTWNKKPYEKTQDNRYANQPTSQPANQQVNQPTTQAPIQPANQAAHQPTS